MITTYRARRRQKIGPKRWREPGELLPELHLARMAHSSLVTGYATEVQIEPEKFVEEVKALDVDADVQERVFGLLGLVVDEKDDEPDVVLLEEHEPEQKRKEVVVPPDVDTEHRIGGPAQPMRRPATKRAARKKAVRKTAAKRPSESLAKGQSAEGEPEVVIRTLD